MYFYEKVHSGRCRDVERPMCDKTLLFLALNSGESELAAAVKAATEDLGLQSILSDFDL